jgi:hypothetical protein
MCHHSINETPFLSKLNIFSKTTPITMKIIIIIIIKKALAKKNIFDTIKTATGEVENCRQLQELEKLKIEICN